MTSETREIRPTPALYEAKIRAELADADEESGETAPSWSGDPLSTVMVVKGVPGEVERAGRAPFSGEDGDALRKALEAVGVPGGFLGVYAGSRGERQGTNEAVARRLALQIASVDPSLIVATDRVAAERTAAALGVKVPAFGRPLRVAATTLLAVDGFEESLGDQQRKQRVWQQIKSLRGAAD